MDRDYLRRGFRYEAWANKRVLEAMRKTPRLSERARQVMAHVAGAGRIWLRRLRGESTEGLAVWPAMGLEECGRVMEENERAYAEFLAGMDEAALAEEVAYRTTTGAEFSSRRADILTHVLMHGAYHRGQLAVEIKRGGGEAATTDFIVYAREGA